MTTTTTLTGDELIAAAEAELSKTKIALMARADSAFFMTLCFNMRHYWDDTVPTAQTDGRSVYWNPKFFMGLLNQTVQLNDREERVFTAVHECMHPAYMHMIRMPAGACPDRWNIACDHVINLQLKDRGFKVPSWTCCDPKFAGMSAEEVYALLPDNPGKPSMQDLKDPGGSLGDKEALGRDLEDILVRARIQSRLAGDKPGTIPGEIELFLNKLLDPKLPWQRILQRFLRAFDKTDYSWQKPNRRLFPQHHLPSLWGESLMDLACVTDTSGSTSGDMFLRFISETYGMLRMMRPKKLTFVQFDTEIKAINDVTNAEELMKIKFKGLGGTDITPVIQWLNDTKPQAAVIFTDGGFHMPELKPARTQVIWLICNNPHWTAPYGKVIHFDMN